MSNNRRNIIYTSGILERLYNLKSNDIKVLNDETSYVSSELILSGERYNIGICTKDYKAYILTSTEILLYDILLSWNALVNLDNKEYIIITFDDIDWIRNKEKQNKQYAKEVHEIYKNAFINLSNLYFICTSEDITQLTACEYIYPLLNIEFIYSNEKIVGIKYNTGKLGNILKHHRMVTTINTNIFQFKLNEDMKYKILRYLLVQIFMNQIKHKTFMRTHRSILSGIVYYDTVSSIVSSYYDFVITSENANKYLSRYISRLDEVLKLLLEAGFIKNYTIIPIKNIREAITGTGGVTISTNVSKTYKKSKVNLS